MESREDAEARLAQELMEGHWEVFDAFVEHFRARIFHYSYLMCGHREDAEEVAQDTLLNAFENFASLRDPRRVRSWIFRIAKNACLMKRRRSVFAPQHELSLEQYLGGNDAHDEQAHDVAGSGHLPDEDTYRHELHAALTAAIQQLPVNYRAVVLLRDVEELSTEETAHILDLSSDVVKQRLHRGRAALRKLLEPYLHLEETSVPECPQIVALLSGYLDRDLPPDTCQAVESHLVACPACQHAEAHLRATIRLCREYRVASRPDPLPPERHLELRQALERVLRSGSA